MKVLEFAFDSRDEAGANDYIPYVYDKNCVVYTGTHDNETLLGWLDNISSEDRKMVEAYLDEKGADKNQAYVKSMNWFVIFGMFIFLGVMFFLPILKYFISPAYFSGLRVVPIVMLAELWFGIFFNLSLWYKLTDRTIWGTWFSLMGLAVTLIINIAFVPVYGYMACAWAAFCCYGFMMVASYAVGRRKYPIPYDLRRLLFYVCAGSLGSVVAADLRQ